MMYILKNINVVIIEYIYMVYILKNINAVINGYLLDFLHFDEIQSICNYQLKLLDCACKSMYWCHTENNNIKKTVCSKCYFNVGFLF